jgi:hypothetical protein
LIAFVLAIAFAAPANAQEGAAALGEPPEGSTRRRPREEAPPPAPDEPWGGPKIELGYSYYAISDGFGGGATHTATFSGFLPFAPFRAGIGAELGGRVYDLGADDFLIRANLYLGYQHMGFGMFAPYAVVVGAAGALIGKRFSASQALAILGLGLEIGADFPVLEPLFLGASFAYIRADVDGFGYDFWTLRLRVGL